MAKKVIIVTNQADEIEIVYNTDNLKLAKIQFLRDFEDIEETEIDLFDFEIVDLEEVSENSN